MITDNRRHKALRWGLTPPPRPSLQTLLIASALALLGCATVSPEAGECREVTFTIGGEDVGFYDADGTLLLDPGRLKIRVGTNSADSQTTAIALT